MILPLRRTCVINLKNLASLAVFLSPQWNQFVAQNTNYGKHRTVRNKWEGKKRAKMSVQEGGQEGYEYSLIAEQHFWGTKASLQLLCSIQAMQRKLGTEAPSIPNIQPSGDIRQTRVKKSQLHFPGLQYGW